ncbi:MULTISPECIES: hypothetical protein [unclassified Solwaraspora]|uniref:hypothetical protein n=1 Tax=unclassified Solwaraspora TaxID=2627926 RepID=UPI00259AFF60|nr:hypothetical protein [Solwaraspora sp. WMMA2056]WJK39446.1 hypothetical protein O7608_23735 [Solwaraspora sp. WMMA2056]
MPDDHTTRNEDATLSRDSRSADVASGVGPTGALRAAAVAGWERLREQRPSGRLVVAAVVVCALGVVAAVESTDATSTASVSEADLQRRAEALDDATRAKRPDPGTDPAAAAVAAADPAAQSAADATDAPATDATDEPAAADPDLTTESPAPAESPTAEPTPTTIAPVAGLSQVQMDNATMIVDAGLALQMPRRAMVIAVATAMQESTLLNRASEVLPESKNYPHQGTGWDHDSVGLFQQRTSTGWGAVADLMNPTYAATQFYLALQRVPGWEQLRLTEAAQAVQVSAYPEHYAQHETAADAVVTAILATR